MAEASLGQTIGPAIVLMGAAVVAVPLFRRLGLGSVLGYFAAGVLVGPSVLGLFTDAAVDTAFLRTRRGDVPVRDRTGTAALQAMGHAWPDLRARPRAGRRGDRGPIADGRAGLRPVLPRSPSSPARVSFFPRRPSSCRSCRTEARFRARRARNRSRSFCSRI